LFASICSHPRTERRLHFDQTLTNFLSTIDLRLKLKGEAVVSWPRPVMIFLRKEITCYQLYYFRFVTVNTKREIPGEKSGRSNQV